MATHRLKGNPDNIYRFRNRSWYLNWECCGVVYRKLFSYSRYGGEFKARAAAVAERDWLEAHRPAVAALLSAGTFGSPQCCDGHRRAIPKLLKNAKALAARGLAVVRGRLVMVEDARLIQTVAAMAKEVA
jgi:hypothetical protein